MIEVLKQMVDALQTYSDKHRKTYLLEGAWDEEITKGDAAIQAGKQAIAKLESQEPVCPECKAEVLYECVACGRNNYPPQRTEQEPVSTIEDLEREIYQNTRNFVSLDVMEWMLKRYYAHPPQRTWVGLTNDELTDLFYNTNLGQASAVAQAIALLKEKNT